MTFLSWKRNLNLISNWQDKMYELSVIKKELKHIANWQDKRYDLSIMENGPEHISHNDREKCMTFVYIIENVHEQNLIMSVPYL